jgi:PPK2 family polyphosphate:nucleotide phosphotransferase
MKLKSPYLIRPDASVRLSKLSTSGTGGFLSGQAAAPVLLKHQATLNTLQDLLFASQQRALLIVLQGMDCSGKDGAIRHIFSGINPQGCVVTSFKVPTPLEARHDFLWRAHVAVPAFGSIGIFNRSHYEDVLSPVVHQLITPKVVRERLADINKFERTLVDNNVLILKFLLHISRQEQANRLKARLDNPDKHWKLDPADFRERRFWPQYTAAYERILEHTSTRRAPWFVIPSDHKWYRNVAISAILVDTLQGLNLKYPRPRLDLDKFKL